VARTYEFEADSLEDAIRQLIDEAADDAGETVDTHLRTRGYDPRRTGTVSVHVVIGDEVAERATPVEDVASADSEDSTDSTDSTDSADEPEDRGGRTRGAVPEKTVEELDEEADVAADFLEGLLDAMDLPGDLQIRILDDAAIVEVVDGDSGSLIGRRGQTLEAIQELARCSLQREFQRRTRVRLDVEGYRERRIEKLLDKADEVIDDVLANGGSERLEPMDVFERKAVHELVATVDGVASRSVGREPGRRVVIEAD
jgi:spoIIIJ-associated protein